MIRKAVAALDGGTFQEPVNLSTDGAANKVQLLFNCRAAWCTHFYYLRSGLSSIHSPSIAALSIAVKIARYVRWLTGRFLQRDGKGCWVAVLAWTVGTTGDLLDGVISTDEGVAQYAVALDDNPGQSDVIHNMVTKLVVNIRVVVQDVVVDTMYSASLDMHPGKGCSNQPADGIAALRLEINNNICVAGRIKVS